MGFVSVIAVLLILVYAAVWVARERRLVARTGMSEHHPVCARCHYALEGWSSPVCPECGQDARKGGVRVGPRRLRHVLVAAWAIVCLGLLAPVFIGLLQIPLTQHITDVHVTRHERGSRVSMLVETNQMRRLFPPRRQHTSAVVLTYRPPTANGSWVNGRFVGNGAVVRELSYDDGSSPPSAAMLDKAFGEIATIKPDQRQALITDIETVIAAFEANRNAPALASALQGITTPAFGARGGAGGSSSSRMSKIAIPIGLIAAALVFWLGARQLIRRCRPGWRPARDDEWTHVRTDT